MAAQLSELFAKVVRQPDADDPRLAYASACDASGDRDRAAFIRIQLAYRDYLRSGRDDGFGDTQRELSLKKAHGASWAGPIKDRVTWYLFFGGFVEKVALDARKFLASADELYGLAPIRRLSLSGAAPVMEQLCHSPHLARLVSLTLERQQLTDRALELIAASPYLGKLVWLDLGFNEITSAGVEALARSNKLRSLRNVSFYGNPVYEDVKERVGDDQGNIAYIDEGLCDLEKRVGRQTWLHPVLDNGRRYLREAAL